MATFESQMSALGLESSAASSMPPLPDGTALGDTTIMAMFRHGGIMVFQSVASGKTLSIYEGQVSGNGLRDEYSQFIIHIRPSGRIALQNVANRDNWLGIYDGRTLGAGSGGPYSEFNLREIDEKYVALESVFYPNQHIGIDEDGGLRPPPDTPARDRTSLFIPFPHSPPPSSHGYTGTTTALPVFCDQPPPYSSLGTQNERPTGSGAAEGPFVPVPMQPTLPTYVPPAHMPHPPPGVYYPQFPGPFPPHQTPAAAPPPPQPVPTEPTAAVGYQVMDLFNQFNKLLLIPYIDLSGRPISACRGLFDSGSLRSGGNYLSAECEFRLQQTSQGIFTLTNDSMNRSVFVNDAKKVTLMRVGTQGIGCEFVLRIISGAVVVFESVKFPGECLSVGSDGQVKLENQPLDSVHAQITIRVTAFNGPYSRILMSPFNLSKESVVNQLKDRSVVQLYHKPTMTYLCLVEGGRILPTPHESQGTFLMYRDRGMGRVSLTGYHQGLLKVKLEFNGRLSSVGAADINMDFYVKECPDGTLMFQSVPFPMHCIQMQHKGVKMTSFSVFLVDMNKVVMMGKKQTVTKYALN